MAALTDKASLRLFPPVVELFNEELTQQPCARAHFRVQYSSLSSTELSSKGYHGFRLPASAQVASPALQRGPLEIEEFRSLRQALLSNNLAYNFPVPVRA